MAAMTDLTSYKTANGLTDPQQFLQVADVNRDGKFNGADLQGLIDYLKGGSGSTVIVPEPATWIWAIISIICLSLAGRLHNRQSQPLSTT